MGKFAIVALLALALGACAPAKPSGPQAAVQTLYDPYLAPDAASKPSHWDKSPLLAKKLRAQINKGLGYGNLLNEPVIDFDPITWSQDGAVSKLTLATTEETEEQAHVVAKFDLSGVARQVEYDLVNDEGIWKIAAIKSGSEDLGAIIDQHIKPAGDPAAMKAPVEAVYVKYLAAAGKPVAALHAWAPLSKSLKPLAAKAAAQNKRLGKDVFGFDPVLDGAVEAIKDVVYEPASSAVIVRFAKGPGVHTVVYDLVEEDGAWRIDNVRSASSYDENWDVRAQLKKDSIE